MSPLAACLQALTAQLGVLRAALEAEGDALHAGEADALPDLVSRKAREVKGLVSQWDALTALLGLAQGASRQAIEQAITRSDPALAQNWAGIVALVDEIGRLNRLNGRLIEEQLRRTQTALTILQSTAGQSALYGADGHSIELFSHHRRIDEA